MFRDLEMHVVDGEVERERERERERVENMFVGGW